MGFLQELADVGLTPAKIDAAVGSSIVIREAVIRKAKEVQEYWQSIAPVSDRGPHPLGAGHEGYIDEPGDYKKSIMIKYDQKATGYFIATVFTKDPKAHWLEYGSIHNPEYGFAQKTVEHFGGTTVDEKGYAGVVS